MKEIIINIRWNWRTNKGKKYNKEEWEQNKRKIVKYFTISEEMNDKLLKASEWKNTSMAKIIEDSLKQYL